MPPADAEGTEPTRFRSRFMKLVRAPLTLGLGLLVLAGCDFPTEAPSLEPRWVFPVETTTLDVDELLPTDVTVQVGNFAMAVGEFFVTRTLGDVCAACAAANGLTVPKPAFTAQFAVDQSLPADVVSATLAGSSVDVTIQNGFSFDPIRLPSGATGTITVTLTDGPGGAQVGQIVIDGATETLATGASVTKSTTLTGTVGNTVTGVVDLDSPAGAPTDLVDIDTAQGFTVTVTPGDVLVSAVTVNVDALIVELEPEPVDTDLDEGMTDRIQEGTLILSIANPFGVSLSGSLNLGTVLNPHTKSFSIPSSATSDVTISYTGAELQEVFRDTGVQFWGSGTISAPGPITVTPGQSVTLEASIDLIILIG
jgi:hypothetical protein